MKNSPEPQFAPVRRSMQVSHAIEDFDAAWRAVATGSVPPRLESVLDQIPAAERHLHLKDLLRIDLENRVKRGERPSVSDYVLRLRADAALIQSVFAECHIASGTDPETKGSGQESTSDPGGAPAPASPEGFQSLKAGTEIGSYTIQRLIGQGGMGAVYQAEHRRMRRKVALKMISPAALKHPEALARFHREAQAMARLEHPNIVTAHDADQAGDIHFLVMQFVDGEDLSTIVKTHGPVAAEKGLSYLIQTAQGLEYAHHEGVIHRDIKPSNLVVAKNGTVKILDMGLARLEDSLSEASPDNRNLTQAGNLMGTVDFMAPEQALDAKEADQRADIYSLGCTFYYIMTGHKLYGGDTPMKRIMAHRFEPIPSLCSHRPDAPPELDPIFQKMVAKNRADRYQSMSEVLAALAPFAAIAMAGQGMSEPLAGRQSITQDLLQPRPGATSSSKFPSVQGLVRDHTSEQTSPSSALDTQLKSHVGERAAPAARNTPSRTDVSSPPVAAPHKEVLHDSGSHSENASWRPHAAKDATSRRSASDAARRRLLGAFAGYVALFCALVFAGYLLFAPSDSDEGDTATKSTLVVDAADPAIAAALEENGIRIKEQASGDLFTLKPGNNELKPGNYVIYSGSLPAGVKLSKKKFQLDGGATETLIVTPDDKK